MVSLFCRAFSCAQVQALGGALNMCLETFGFYVFKPLGISSGNRSVQLVEAAFFYKFLLETKNES